MKKRKIFAAALALLILLQLFAGCSKEDVYFWDNAKGWLTQEFQKDNIVTLGFLGEPREYPANRTIVIDTRDEYDRAFEADTSAPTADFSQQMMVLYTFVDTNRNKFVLTDIGVENGVLKFVCEDVPSNGDTCSPYQRWFLVKLNKVDVQSVEFERIEH